MIVCKKYSQECFLKHDIYFEIDSLDLFLELKFLHVEENTTIDCCFCSKKFFQIKIDKILLKIDYCTRSERRTDFKFKNLYITRKLNKYYLIDI